MQENEFERQVRQKTDDLKLHPSGAVWQKIEVRIKKEKRRRWVLFMLPVLLIGSLYGGYVLFNSNNSNTLAEQKAAKNLTEKIPPVKESTADPYPMKSERVIKEDTVGNAQAATLKRHSDQQIKTQPKLNINSEYAVSENVEKDPALLLKNQKDTSANIQHEKTAIAVQNPQQEKIAGNTDSTTGKIELSNQAITGIAEDEKTEIKKDTRKIKPAKKQSWNLSVALAGGVSSMANSFLGYGDQKADVAYSNNFPGTVTGNYPLGPSLIKPSLAFMAGVSAERNLSKKIIFTTGLTYKLFSTTNTVGNDSGRYYRLNNATRTYHNHYHYLEVPVGFKFQVINLNRTRLYWNTGLSISRLISSNALQFNSFTRFYYRDNSIFNKTQIGFNTGLDVAFISKEKQSFLIGPYFNYGISKIAGEGYNNHHFTFMGVRAQYFFSKK